MSDDSDQLEAFNRVVAALTPLSQDARAHLWKTVAMFFRLDQVGTETRAPTSQTATHQTATAPARFTDDHTPSPKQFVLDKKPRTDVDRVVCLAYYLTHYRSTPEFKTIDLSSLNTEAAQVKFSNAAKAVDNATRSGLLVAASKGMKQLSAPGEVYVNHLPDVDAAREAMKDHRPKRNRRRLKGNENG